MNEPKWFLRFAKYAQVITQIGFVSTNIFCFMLIYLTVFEVKRNFGSYKRLLVLFPMVGIFFASVELILYPNAYSHNAGYVFYTASSPFNLNKEYVMCFLAFFTGVYASTISMLAVQFLYRYWAIFDESKLRFFKGWRFFIWIVYSILFGVQWGVGIYHFDKIDDYSRGYMENRWDVFLCAFTLFPAMDALIVMYVVADYKRAARQMLRRVVDKVSAWLSTFESEQSVRTRSTNVNTPAVIAMNNL